MTDWFLGNCRCTSCGHRERSIWPSDHGLPGAWPLGNGPYVGYMQCSACHEMTSWPSEAGHVVITEGTMAHDINDDIKRLMRLTVMH